MDHIVIIIFIPRHNALEFFVFSSDSFLKSNQTHFISLSWFYDLDRKFFYLTRVYSRCFFRFVFLKLIFFLFRHSSFFFAFSFINLEKGFKIKKFFYIYVYTFILFLKKVLKLEWQFIMFQICYFFIAHRTRYL